MREAERALAMAAMVASSIELDTTIPSQFERHRKKAQQLVAEVEEIYGNAARSDYFATSKLRYEQYFSIANEINPAGRVLEIGSAPGHVSIGLSLMGFALTCVNLNELYRSTYPSTEWFARLNVMEHDFESRLCHSQTARLTWFSLPKC
jgi:hypothetical protein